MKKAITVIISMVLVVSMSTALADLNFNIDDYTEDELAEIYSIVSKKVMGCIRVPAGLYVVGKDFPAGTYSILSNRDVPDSTSDDFSHVAIFNNMEEYNKDPHNFFNDDSLAVIACNTLWGGMSCDMTDGMVLIVNMGKAGLSKVNSNIFDAFWK